MKSASLLALSILFLMSFSCEKMDCKEKCLDNPVYYSEDYKNSNINFLGVSAQDLDVLYFEFFKDKSGLNRYKFIGKQNDQA